MSTIEVNGKENVTTIHEHLQNKINTNCVVFSPKCMTQKEQGSSNQTNQDLGIFCKTSGLDSWQKKGEELFK